MSYEPTEEEWRGLARQVVAEKDPEKTLELAQQVIEKYDKEKRRKRQHPPDSGVQPSGEARDESLQ
jgi:hypothetical protein